jgi:DNA-binding GntR family transcriptional regulator
MKIDPRSPGHPYQQHARHLRERIKRGEITSQLPSITDLTEQTGLVVGTVRRAIDILANEGLVQTVPGRGTARSCGDWRSPRWKRGHDGGPRTLPRR